MVGIKIESVDAIWIWEFGNNVIFQAQNKNIEHIYNALNTGGPLIVWKMGPGKFQIRTMRILL